MWSAARHRFTLRQTVSTMEKADSITLVLARVRAIARGTRKRCTVSVSSMPAQPLLAIFRAAQTGSPNRNLLPVHHAVTVFFPPAMSATLGVLLMTLSSQVPNFLLHNQVHQQSGLAQQVADSFLQKSHDLGHGKDHLDAGILFAGLLQEGVGH